MLASEKSSPFCKVGIDMAPGAITRSGLAAHNGFALRTTKSVLHYVTMLIVRINRLYIDVTGAQLVSQTLLPL
jgi:hypothetical protein